MRWQNDTNVKNKTGIKKMTRREFNGAFAHQIRLFSG